MITTGEKSIRDASDHQSSKKSQTCPDLDSDLDVLARPGGNDRVVEKKMLLAALARQEADRLGILPDAVQVQTVKDAFQQGLGLPDPESMLAWLTQEGLTMDELNMVMSDFATVLAVESHYRQRLSSPAELHRRLMAARSRRLAQEDPPR